MIPLTGPSSRRMDAGVSGVAGKRELVFNGHRVSFWDDEAVQDTDDVDGYTRNGAFLPLIYSFKTGSSGKFYVMYILL